MIYVPELKVLIRGKIIFARFQKANKTINVPHNNGLSFKDTVIGKQKNP